MKNKGIQALSIPETKTILERGCFEECKNIEQMSIPNSVVKIYPKCFVQCFFSENSRNISLSIFIMQFLL
jgi:hypothetical protein